jgi:hypothetical protein
MSELQSNSVEGRMMEVEQAAMNTQAQARLSEIKSRLGITTGTEGTPSAIPAEGETATGSGTASAAGSGDGAGPNG